MPCYMQMNVLNHRAAAPKHGAAKIARRLALSKRTAEQRRCCETGEEATPVHWVTEEERVTLGNGPSISYLNLTYVVYAAPIRESDRYFGSGSIVC